MQQRTQCRLFVGNIAGSVTTEDLREVLEKYGEVTDLYFNKEKFYAFVKYAVSGAERAQQELHGMMLKGRHLNVHDGGVRLRVCVCVCVHWVALCAYRGVAHVKGVASCIRHACVVVHTRWKRGYVSVLRFYSALL